MLSRKEIDKKIMEYLIKKKPQLGRFYLLPKVHKRTFNVPGRPVISNNGTRDFLRRLNDLPEIPENTILVTFDVVGLYKTSHMKRV